MEYKEKSGTYLGDCQFLIGDQRYLINPYHVKSIHYDDTQNMEKITLYFNDNEELLLNCHGRHEYEWHKISKGFLRSWQIAGFNVWDIKGKSQFYMDLKHEEMKKLEQQKRCGKITDYEYDCALEQLGEKYAVLLKDDDESPDIY